MLRPSSLAVDLLNHLIGPDFVLMWQRAGWFLLTFAVVVTVLAIAAHCDSNYPRK
jgi:uncharacterized membrane protein